MLNIGVLLTVMAFAAMTTSVIAYLLAGRGREQLESLAKLAYVYATVFISVMSVFLMFLFLVGDYSYKYVFEYSSSSLPLFYTISAFWGGQQGTYLLWLLLSTLMGYYIIARGREFKNIAMFFLGGINLFLLTMLLVLSPFEKLPVPQPDGLGLNPLLQDPWMVIHPPVMFVGFAALGLPCAIALAALIRNKFENWFTVALPMIGLSALALGAGNIMGGFWAYKTLGWGGYWAWDPVENAAFVPWMVSLALIHGVLIERHNGALRKTNLFLAIIGFLLVVYGTFLTRSGVLADFSVHSFVNLGVNNYLIGFMIGFSAFALLLLLYRSRGINSPPVNLTASSQEFTLVLSIWLLLLIGLMVLAGTSWPLITTLLGAPAAVDTMVYNKVTFPLAIVIAALLGISPVLYWRGGRLQAPLKVILPAFFAALVAVVIALFLGVTKATHVLYIFAAAFALFTNLFSMAKYLPNNWGPIGARISHVGFALMLIGILGSSAYSTGEKLVLNKGNQKSAYGLDFAYKGMAGQLEDPENELIVEFADASGKTYEARPRLYFSERMNGIMKRPHIERFLFYDLYLAPERIIGDDRPQGVRIARGDTIRIGGYQVNFLEFDQVPHDMSSTMTFGAILEVSSDTYTRDTIVPSIIFNPGQSFDYIDVPIAPPDDSSMVRLEGIYADDGAVMISVAGATEGNTQQLVLEISQKPTMNILWSGTIILALGFVISLQHRWRQARQNGAKSDSA